MKVVKLKDYMGSDGKVIATDYLNIPETLPELQEVKKDAVAAEVATTYATWKAALAAKGIVKDKDGIDL